MAPRKRSTARGIAASDEERRLAERTLPVRGDGPGVDPDVWLLHVCYATRPDGELRRLLVEEYRGYALSLARRMHREGEPLDDLRQVAFEALLRSLDRFDPERGCPFLGFASLTITGALKRHFRDFGWLMRVPRRVHELAAPIRDATDALTVSLQRTPTVDEIAAWIGVDAESVIEAQDATHARSLSALPVYGDDSEGPQRDTLGTEDPAFDRQMDVIDLRRALDELDESDRELVRSYFFEERTQSQIAADLGVSQMQVSRLVASVTRRLASRTTELV